MEILDFRFSHYKNHMKFGVFVHFLALKTLSLKEFLLLLHSKHDKNT